MNVSKYKALLAAVDLGSFSAAAAKLGYTQSGMTHMMNALEDELDIPILQRGYWGVKLTSEGEKIIPRIRDLVNCEDALRNEIDLLKSYGGNVIRIGAFSSLAASILPPIAERFNAEFPGVTVNIQMGTVDELYGGLSDGKYDLCFGTKNNRYNFKWTSLMQDPYYAILPKDYPVISETFPIQQFNGTKFLMPGLGYDDDISEVFSKYKVRPFVTSTYVDDPAIISMVDHNLGISMLSALTITVKRDNVRIMPVSPTVARNICISILPEKVLSQPMRRLIMIAREYTKTYVHKF